MSLFECCAICKPPKRHIGCHSTCEDYLKCKKILNKRNEVIFKAKKEKSLNDRYYRRLGQR